MATLRNEKKLAALNKENSEEHARSNLTQNSNVPRSQEDYTTQVSEKIEGRVTKKLSQEISRIENRILGALSRLDGFLKNPVVQGHSGTAPETSRNAYDTKQETNEDDSQSVPHPEAGVFQSRMTQNSGPGDDQDTKLLPILEQWLTLILWVRSNMTLKPKLQFGRMFAKKPSKRNSAKWWGRIWLLFRFLWTVFCLLNFYNFHQFFLCTILKQLFFCKICWEGFPGDPWLYASWRMFPQKKYKKDREKFT